MVWMIVSLTAAKTSRMFALFVAWVMLGTGINERSTRGRGREGKCEKESECTEVGGVRPRMRRRTTAKTRLSALCTAYVDPKDHAAAHGHHGPHFTPFAFNAPSRHITKNLMNEDTHCGYTVSFARFSCMNFHWMYFVAFCRSFPPKYSGK
jgi:hypothetical protein